MGLDASPAPDPSNRGGGGGIPIPSTRPPNTRPPGAATYVQLWSAEGRTDLVVRTQNHRRNGTSRDRSRLAPDTEQQRRARGDHHSSRGTARSRACHRLSWSGDRIEYRPHPHARTGSIPATTSREISRENRRWLLQSSRNETRWRPSPSPSCARCQPPRAGWRRR